MDRLYRPRRPWGTIRGSADRRIDGRPAAPPRAPNGQAPGEAMERSNRVRIWPIDPAHVHFATVTPPGVHGAQTSWVRVWYEGDSSPKFVPLGTFITETKSRLAIGHLLGIEHLSVSPKSYHRYRDFFDRLSDWTRARQKILSAAREEKIRAKRTAAPDKLEIE
jgi:hypothetical protein